MAGGGPSCERAGVIEDIGAASAFGKGADIRRYNDGGAVIGSGGVGNIGAGEHCGGRKVGMLGGRVGRRGAFEDGSRGGKHGVAGRGLLAMSQFITPPNIFACDLLSDLVVLC